MGKASNRKKLQRANWEELLKKPKTEPAPTPDPVNLDLAELEARIIASEQAEMQPSRPRILHVGSGGKSRLASLAVMACLIGASSRNA